MALRRTHRVVLLASTALVLGALATGWHLRTAPTGALANTAASAPLPQIEAMAVAERLIADQRTFSGRIEAVEQVDVRPLVSGTIDKVHFADGSLVTKGQPLFTVDPRPFQAALDKAEGDLKSAQAAVLLARSDVERARQLIGKGTITQREHDIREHDLRASEARILVAAAAVAAARLDLEHSVVTAPIDGRISRAEVTEGNVVMAGTGAAPLTRIVSVAAVYAAFDADEQSYLAFIGHARRTDRPLAVEIALAGEGGFSRAGRIASIDNRLDPSSGTIRVRAIVDNADGALIPGLYVRVRVSGGDARPAMLVDARAVAVDQDKKFVLVVGEDDRIAYREVKLGADRDGQRLVLSGLSTGERVVVAGAQAVKPGDRVKIVAPEVASQ